MELGARSAVEGLLEREQADVVIPDRLLSWPASLMHEKLIEDGLVIFFDHSVRSPIKSVVDYAAARHATLDFGGTQKSNVEIELEKQGLSRTVVLNTPNAWPFLIDMLTLNRPGTGTKEG